MNLQNKSIVLNIVLAVVVVVLGVRLVSGETSTENTASELKAVNAEQAVLDNIATRTSIRNYEARKVEKEKIEKILRAAMAAPTAMNKQPWHFVVVDKRDVLDALAEVNPYAKMLKKAPLAIVVCGDTDKMIEGGHREPSACRTCHGTGSSMDWSLSIRGALQGNKRCSVVVRQPYPPQHDCHWLSGGESAT